MPSRVSLLTRIFVADSNPISSQLLAESLARKSRIEVLGFSSDPLSAARMLGSCPADVLLVSARMNEEPNRGLSLLQQLRTEGLDIKAVVLLDSSKADIVVQAFQSGASGVFCRNTELSLLHKCVLAVHRGEVWANNEELGFLLTALGSSVSYHLREKPLAALTRREKEVVESLAEGLTNREIARQMAISQHTVKNYIFKIFDKLGVSNRVELVRRVLSESTLVRSTSLASYEPKMPGTEGQQHDRMPSAVQ
jgi:DNA-binding NarL/FixJ family response regulator